MFRLIDVRPCLPFVLILLLVSWSDARANPEYRFRDGSPMEIQWYEQEGHILNEHVCFNYRENRRRYRQCRNKAVAYFEDECRFYSEKYESTHERHRDIYLGEKDKFCGASESYTP